MSPRILKPIFIKKIWGGRSLKRFYNKPLPAGKKIGESWELWRKAENTPFVIKLLDVKKPLSVQVHPKGKRGKSEAWYFLRAGKPTRVVAGLTKKIDKKDVRPENWPQLMGKYKVKAGDFVYLPGGTIHTIYPPAVILEVSQPKLITYRLYDWGRKRGELDTEVGLKTLQIANRPRIYRQARSFRCPFFRLEIRTLKAGTIIKLRKRKFYVLFIVKGEIEINNLVLHTGQTVILPSTAIIKGLINTRILEIFI